MPRVRRKSGMKDFYACNFRLPTRVAEFALRRKISNVTT